MAEQKNFPFIPASHWHNLRIQFKKSIPGSITTNYLASTLSMSESSAGANILPGLRHIGLIDSENKTNQEMAKKFRDDAAYAQLCAEIIEKIYPEELRDAFPDKDSNRDKVKTWFMNHTGSGDSAATKASAFYLTLLEADASSISKASAVTGKDSNKTKEGKPKAKKPGDATNPATPIHEQGAAANTGGKNSGPDLNINIQIHISSDASPDQIKSIFENMAKYLYKN